MSTFHGLEMAKQAMFAQRSALYTTGHNISNANTEGYSRQRVNFQTASPYPVPALNRPGITGQMGTGVEAGTVERVRNKFLDLQYRAENSKAGFWESKSEALSRLEELMNEPSESGLSKTMDQLWESLQDLAGEPTNSGARSVVAHRALALAESFNYTSESLSSIRDDLKEEIDVTVEDANSLVRQVDKINKQIKQVEPHGYLANDLYDERDRLIDELSGMVNIKVTYDESGDSSPDIADGLATIEVVDDKGKPLGDSPVLLLDGEKGDIQEIKVEYDKDNQDAVSKLSVGHVEDEEDVNILNSNGSLTGNIEMYGYEMDSESGKAEGTYTDMLTDLDNMAKAFADKFNGVHGDVEDSEGNTGLFFEMDDSGEIGSAESITVNQAILDDPDLIIASTDGEYGNNASDLADVFDESLGEDFGDTSVRKFYESLTGNLGVAAQEANRMKDNTDILRSQVEDRRMSTSAVSLDEEMTNMIKFQQAYNAAARSMTATDEMIERVINNMGLVGR